MVLSQDQSVNQNAETATTTTFQESVSTFAYGANFKVVGKCDPQKLSYVKAFKRTEGTMRDLLNHIAQGHPWMPAILDEGARRQQAQANYAEVLAVDIDSGMTIEQCFDHPFIGQYCGLGVESSSSTSEHNKFRLVFRLSTPLTNWEDIRLCNQYLIEKIGVADPSCKDASRFFFGAEDREEFILNDIARLPEDFLDQAKQWQADQENAAKALHKQALNEYSRHQEQNPDDKIALVRSALKFISPKTSPGDGMYGECFPILAGLAHEFGAAIAEALVNEWSPTVPKSGWNVPKMIDSVLKGSAGRNATLGTVFHVAKQNGFRFPQKATRVANSRRSIAIAASSQPPAEQTYEQIEWKCLDVVEFQIGSWKELYLADNSQARIDALHKQIENGSKSLRWLGMCVDDKKRILAHFQTFEAKADFTFEISRVLQGSEGGGLILRLQRIEGTQLRTKDVYINSSDTGTAKDFMLALRKGYGQNLVSTLKNEEVQELLQNREAVYRRNGGKTYRLADRVGKQDCGTWVFENCQFKKDGTPTSEEETLIVFNDRLGQEEQIPSPQIAPQDTNALNRLVLAIEQFFGTESIGKILRDCGQAVAIMNRDTVMKSLSFFPQSWVFGEKGAGKTLSATISVSLVGMQHFTISNFTVSLLYERFKSLGCLPFLVDDPIKPGRKQQDTREQLEKILWDSYNGFGRVVRGNEQKPQTCALFTSNVAIGDGAQALISRLLMSGFAKGSLNKSAGQELKDAIAGASGGFSQLASINYDHTAFREICNELAHLMESVDSRLIESLALNIYFTEKFLEKARYDFDYRGFCIKSLIPQMVGYDSTKDSLTDFLEKLSLMNSEGEVGGWNVTEVSPRSGGYFLAVDLASVWQRFEQKYTPNYSRQSLNALILAAGGKTNEKQKFVPTKLECVDYQRAIAEFNRRSPEERSSSLAPQEPKKTRPCNCVMIPMSLILGQSIEAQKPEAVEDESEPATVETKPEPETIETQAAAVVQAEIEIPPLPEGWRPQVGDAVCVLDRQSWEVAIVKSIPGDQTFWKLELEATDEKPGKLLTIHSIDAMRPLEALA